MEESINQKIQRIVFHMECVHSNESRYFTMKFNIPNRQYIIAYSQTICCNTSMPYLRKTKEEYFPSTYWRRCDGPHAHSAAPSTHAPLAPTAPSAHHLQ